jgi:hypothetical protein
MDTWYPHVNDTVTVDGCEILGIFEGKFAVEKTIPPSLSTEGLVRFMANQHEAHKQFLSRFYCFNPNSKFSRLCVIPLNIIRQKDHNGKPKGQTSGIAR